VTLSEIESTVAPGAADKATALLSARDEARCLPTFTAADPSFSLADAYVVADEIRRRRIAAGDTPRGYKIGFTNRGIWDRYGVHAPIWGPIWNSTLEFADSNGEASVSLAPFVQPRLEPEIMFSFATPPAPGMNERELAACIDWVAHGFEIVHTHFEGWRFRAADTVADFALHGRLVVGARAPMTRFGDAAAELAALQLTLVGDGVDVETGRADIVLGGPLTALGLWVDAMAAQPHGWRIERGDIVSTGTITDAAPLAPGQRWHTLLGDARLQGLALRTET
jgi:2-oxo-3-hexenedioate decarboxylase